MDAVRRKIDEARAQRLHAATGKQTGKTKAMAEFLQGFSLLKGYDDEEMRVVCKDGSSFPISEGMPRELVAGEDYEVE